MALTVRPADIIKAKVIDYLVDNYDGIVIGDEVIYGSNRKIVDLLALYNGETYAIEIKSGKDDLRRLADQLSEYSKIFDHTMVFTTKEHMNKILEVTNTKVSVYVVSSDEEIHGRLIDKRNNVLKGEMLATMNASFIKRSLTITKAKDSDDVRKKAMKYRKESIHSLLYKYFINKLSVPYRLFLREREGKTEIDDICILSNRLIVD